jgi:hypothetical protein
LEETLQNKPSDQQTETLSDDDDASSSLSSPPQQQQQRLTNGHHSSTVNGHDKDSDEEKTVVDRPDAKGPSASVASCDDDKDRWREYLGDASEPTANILIRYPDGRRDAWRQPAGSQLRALVLFVACQGFGPDKYELVTNFPRRVLSSMELTSSLRDCGLHPQETVFVQLKD